MKNLILIFCLLFSINVKAQQLENDFQKNLYLQNLDHLSAELSEKYKLNFDLILLDSSNVADLNFTQSISNLEGHKNFFLISNYIPSKNMGNNINACFIIIDYRNKVNFYYHSIKYKEMLGEKKSIEFVNFFLIAHELGHCIVRNNLNENAIQEEYADSIASFLIKDSIYKEYVNIWIDNLKVNKGIHNTNSYVFNFYEKTKSMKSLEEVVLFLKNNK